MTKAKKIIIICSLVILLIIGIFVGIQQNKKKQEAQYRQDYKIAVAQIGQGCVNCANVYQQYFTIDKLALMTGTTYDYQFNNLTAGDKDAVEKNLKKLKDDKIQIDNDYAKVKKVPNKEWTEAYDNIKELYNLYLKLNSYATSAESFSTDDADTFMKLEKDCSILMDKISSDIPKEK